MKNKISPSIIQNTLANYLYTKYKGHPFTIHQTTKRIALFDITIKDVSELVLLHKLSLRQLDQYIGKINGLTPNEIWHR